MLDVHGRLLFIGRSTPRGLPGCPGTAFLIFGQNADPGCLGGWVGPGPAGPRKIFETFCMGVGFFFGGAGWVKIPTPQAGGSAWVGRQDPKVPGWDPPLPGLVKRSLVHRFQKKNYTVTVRRNWCREPVPAPNVYALNFLQHTSAITPEFKARGIPTSYRLTCFIGRVKNAEMQHQQGGESMKRSGF